MPDLTGEKKFWIDQAMANEWSTQYEESLVNNHLVRVIYKRLELVGIFSILKLFVAFEMLALYQIEIQ